MMECSRCHGLMVMDTFLNMENIHKTVWIYEWRCVNCGEIFDSQTLSNRKICQSKSSPRRGQEVA